MCHDVILLQTIVSRNYLTRCSKPPQLVIPRSRRRRGICCSLGISQEQIPNATSTLSFNFLLELNVVDLHRGEILPVAPLNLVLIGPLELEHGQFLAASLFHDLSGHAGFAGIGAHQNLLIVRMDRQDGTKIDFLPYFAFHPLNANGVTGRDAILLSPGLNDSVHLPSKCPLSSLKRSTQTLIIAPFQNRRHPHRPISWHSE